VSCEVGNARDFYSLVRKSAVLENLTDIENFNIFFNTIFTKLMFYGIKF
jgi:Mg2+/Co2+ transporter CorC